MTSRWQRPAVSWRRPSRRSVKFSKKPTVRSNYFPWLPTCLTKLPRARVLPARGNLSKETARQRPSKFLSSEPSSVSTPCAVHLCSDQAKSGCRHKEKTEVKQEQRVAAAAASITKANGNAKEEKKDKAKKKEIKDANGNVLKRPLSAYMLYNNHRRPTLRSEHPGK